MTAMYTWQRSRQLRGLAVVWILAMGVTHAQEEDVRELVERYWNDFAPEGRADLLAGGLVREDAESKAYALLGVARLIAEAPDVARARFAPDDIRRHFSDSDKDVVKQALHAYQLLVPDDSSAEVAIVERAQSGGGPLEDWEYVRYLRPTISSDAALTWLLELVEGQISPSKYVAAEALARGMDAPPPSLLPELMQLIESPEYFCDYNLVRSLPKFGSAAREYKDELIALRERLVEQAELTQEDRSVSITAPPEDLLRVLDQAISSL